jgi:hypothetical protein
MGTRVYARHSPQCGARWHSLPPRPTTIGISGWRPPAWSSRGRPLPALDPAPRVGGRPPSPGGLEGQGKGRSSVCRRRICPAASIFEDDAMTRAGEVQSEDWHRSPQPRLDLAAPPPLPWMSQHGAEPAGSHSRGCRDDGRAQGRKQLRKPSHLTATSLRG